mmetsp:Transcript_15207/g.25280  ORF Transcript_15207/g.25280 Transcript_15207/m.25280 type:complete len:258 (-) Transcript_15207:1209-1982(-)
MNARCVHGIHRGESVSLITSVLTIQSSNIKHAKASVFPPTNKLAAGTIPPTRGIESMLGRSSQPRTSTKSLPRSPVPTSIQFCDRFLDSASICANVSHFVAFDRSGSGCGFTRISLGPFGNPEIFGAFLVFFWSVLLVKNRGGTNVSAEYTPGSSDNVLREKLTTASPDVSRTAGTAFSTPNICNFLEFWNSERRSINSTSRLVALRKRQTSFPVLPSLTSTSPKSSGYSFLSPFPSSSSSWDKTTMPMMSSLPRAS